MLAVSATAQETIPLDADHWSGDTVRFETFLDRPSLYLEKGTAIAKGITLDNGTIEFDMATRPKMRFLGVVFREESADRFESVFFRPGASNTPEAVQYQPNLLGSGTWEIFHGDGEHASADFPRDTWIHVRVEITGSTARVFLRGDEKPLLSIPRLASGSKTGGLGFWTGPFGNGGYFSNVRYQRTIDTPAVAAAVPLADGTIREWQLSPAFDAATVPRDMLPDLSHVVWQNVEVEQWSSYGDRALGLVLINRYRRAPNATPPPDEVKLLAGRVPGSQVIYARATIHADAAQSVRMHFGYSDGVVVFANGQPLFFGMNPFGLRATGGVMESTGEAVYLPLKRGNNEIVLAVTEFFGGWGFWTRLDANEHVKP